MRQHGAAPSTRWVAVVALLVLPALALGGAAGNDLWWARSDGGTEYNQGQAIASFDDGSCVATGLYFGAAQFGTPPWPTTELASRGAADVFVSRYDSRGILAWARNIGGGGYERAWGVASYPDGSCVVTGDYTGSTVVGEGETTEVTLPYAAVGRAFVARFHEDGALAWAASAGGADPCHGIAVATCADGSCVVTGEYSGTAQFGAISITSSGGADVFVAKYDASGVPLWARGAGGGVGDAFGRATDGGRAVASFEDGSCVVTGSFAGPVVFGEGEANETALVSKGWQEIFIAKYAGDGDLEWARSAGGQSYDYGNGVAALSRGSFVVTGGIGSDATFGTRNPRDHVETLKTGDIFFHAYLAKYDRDGRLVWARLVNGPPSYAMAYGVAPYPGPAPGRQPIIRMPDTDACVITGCFIDTVPFGSAAPGDHIERAVSEGETDIFVARYRGDGTLAWVETAGGLDYDASWGVASYPYWGCAVTGEFTDTATFGMGTLNETDLATATPGNRNMFAARYGPSSLTVLYPNGGEKISRGSDVALRWDPRGNVGDRIRYAVVKPRGLIAWKTVPNTGSCLVRLALPAGGGYRLQIQSVLDPALKDESDGPFSIR